MKSLILLSFESHCVTLVAGVVVLVTAHMSGTLVTPEITIRVLIYLAVARRDLMFMTRMIIHLNIILASVSRINVSNKANVMVLLICVMIVRIDRKKLFWYN